MRQAIVGLMLKLKLQYFGHLMWRADSFEKTLMLGKIEGRRRRGDRGWDGWMASPTRWTWIWVNSRSWWWTGRPDVLQFMGSQRVGHDWATKLSWSSLNSPLVTPKVLYAFCLSFQNISSNISYLKWHLKQFLPKISLKVQVKSKHSHNVWPWRSLRSYHF